MSYTDGLAADFLADIVDRVAHFAARGSEPFLNVARGLVGLAFLAHLLVVCQIACGLLDLALELVGLAVDFIFVPHDRLHRCGSKRRTVRHVLATRSSVSM